MLKDLVPPGRSFDFVAVHNIKGILGSRCSDF